MNYLKQYQWHMMSVIFGVSFITILAFLLPIRKLYTYEETRQIATQLIERSADQYGLPKSDFFFTYIGKHDYRLCRREYGRGNDPITCDWHTVFTPSKR